MTLHSNGEGDGHGDVDVAKPTMNFTNGRFCIHASTLLKYQIVIRSLEISRIVHMIPDVDLKCGAQGFNCNFLKYDYIFLPIDFRTKIYRHKTY